MLKLHRSASPRVLFAFGLVAFPAFVFMPFLAVRAALCLLFLALSLASGKRFRPITTLLMAVSIVAFNLVVPMGLVLVRLWNFPLTQGALLGGIEKAVTVQGLIWLSHVVILPGLRFPGVTGELLSGSFAWLARVNAASSGFSAKDPFGSLDRMLIKLWDGQAETYSAPSAGTPSPDGPTGADIAITTRSGLTRLAVLALACLGPYVLLLADPAALPDWLRA